MQLCIRSSSPIRSLSVSLLRKLSSCRLSVIALELKDMSNCFGSYLSKFKLSAMFKLLLCYALISNF